MSKLDEIRARLDAATPGPWRWEVNRKHKTVEICGGLPAGLFDKTVLAFRRYGMKGAAPEFWRWGEGGKWLGKPQRADELAVAYPGREHHAGWCADIDHPDARLIAAAPTDIAFLLAEIDRRTIERDAAEALAAASKHPHHGVTRANRAKWRGEIADLRAKLASAERTAQEWAERATLLERELAAAKVKLADREGV